MRVLQRSFHTLPQNLERRFGRSVNLVPSRDGRGQCASVLLDVSTVYMTEPVWESRIVVLRISSSSFGAKDKFIFMEVTGSGGEEVIDMEDLEI